MVTRSFTALVSVRHGAGAGWSLARVPDEITLLQVYDAVGQESLVGMHRQPCAGPSRAVGIACR